MEQRERLTNTFLPALFLCGALIKCIYTAKIKKEYPQKLTCEDFEDIEEIEDLFLFLVTADTSDILRTHFGHLRENVL